MSLALSRDARLFVLPSEAPQRYRTMLTHADNIFRFRATSFQIIYMLPASISGPSLSVLLVAPFKLCVFWFA